MPRTYQKCDDAHPQVREMVNQLLHQYESHQPLIDAQVKIDLLFAYNPDGDALSHGGYPALALAKKIPLEQRVKGMGDVQISIDGHWWKGATEEQQRALLDHELHHFQVNVDENGICRDDLGRPEITLRKHDVQHGWFDIIARRHGANSQECIQAKRLFEEAGQLYWPHLTRAHAA